MSQNQEQYLRKASLILRAGSKGLDLSETHFTFKVSAADVQSPNHAAIRVYNLAQSTVDQVRREFSEVILQAGYEQSAFGVIFSGTIKQFRIGRENATDTYLDILAADSDLGYNFGICDKTWAAGSTPSEHIAEAARAMGLQDIRIAPDLTGTNPQLARGKVGFGMARDLMSKAAKSLGATWSIQQGVAQVIGFQGYLPGEVRVVNSMTGMIGIPQQTDQGVEFQTLLDPKFQIGTLVQLDNKTINQLILQNPTQVAPYDSYRGLVYVAKVQERSDGLYRVYVVEHEGDTRGQEWYSNLICLAYNPAANQVEARD